MSHLQSISPLDGRYHEETKALQDYFSEFALIRYRLLVEVEYFIALSLIKELKEFPAINVNDQKILRSLSKNFSLQDAEEIKKIEATTHHDVKAVEYFLQHKIQKTSLKKYTSFIHFALTSEDCNNLAYGLMWNNALQHEYIPQLKKVYNALVIFAKENKKIPMIGMTHGQSATPTTVGKEIAVFTNRLERQIKILKKQKFQGKLSGATGTWAAHLIAYPQINWKNFSKKFITSLGLEPNLLTTQIEPHDSLIESFHCIHRINSILLDFSKDIWLYISRGIFLQQKKENEIGSSTMPHKINPIYFENAEGNLGIANAFFDHLANKLPISRLQRDLSDSTVMRNTGVPLAHSLLAYTNILTGLSRLEVNTPKLQQELNEHWEILAEPIQTVLRKYGDETGYEKLKQLTRGEKITQKNLHTFIKQLDLPIDEQKKLLQLRPDTYIGYADNPSLAKNMPL